ncbi:MAG: DUF2799 domain-containing protein [Methylococcales bacterium]|nr:DUF2799 domain-containing protein [Methylococcales bacterium]MCK5924640.1 DUF2799 domain-containing protein [Methylococcales bacterium]
MMALRGIFLRLIPFLLLSSCATLSQEDCMQGAWFDLGKQDGREGKTFKRLAEHQESCTKYGIGIDREAYNAGRKQGLDDYCQLDNAVDLGLRGYRYRSVCPSEIHPAFLRYNQMAYDVYQDKKNLENVDKRLSYEEKSLLDANLSDEKRSQIRVEIHDLDRERNRVRDALYSKERRLNALLNKGY